MIFTLVALSVLGLIEIAVAVLAVRVCVRRLGAGTFFRGVLGDAARRDQDRLPRLRFRARDLDGQYVTLPARDTRLLFFIRPRCLASHSLAGVIAEQGEGRRPECSLTLVVVGDDVSARRLAASLPAFVETVQARPRQFPRSLRSALPCAVSLGEGGRVRHFGKIGGPSELVRFAEASGDYEVRQWCRYAFSRSVRARALAMPAGQSTVSNLDVLTERA